MENKMPKFLKPSLSHRSLVRRHWSHLTLRFTKSGAVYARKGYSGPWGILYTPTQLASHLATLTKGEPA